MSAHLAGRERLAAVLLRLALMVLLTGLVALGLAGTATAAAAKKSRQEWGIATALGSDGRLWVVSKDSDEDGDFLNIKHSRDEGKSWSPPVRINRVAEAIVATGEEPPQLLLQPGGKMLVAWTRPGKKYAGDIRSAVSTDGGETWSSPVTVQRDDQQVAHRQVALARDADNRVYAIWIDRRHVSGNAAVPRYRGATLYYAVSDDGGANWRGDYRLADHACDCCRLALVNGEPGASGPLLFWRQVFDGGVRDHALMRVSPDGKAGTIGRATFDDWKVDACPDHGPTLALADGVGHAAWFTRRGDASQLVYGRWRFDKSTGTLAAPLEGRTVLPDGAEHPAIVASGARVWLVWKAFDGKATRIGAWISADGGKNWQQRNLASTQQASDHPRLLQDGARAILVWHTRQEGLIVRRMEE